MIEAFDTDDLFGGAGASCAKVILKIGCDGRGRGGIVWRDARRGVLGMSCDIERLVGDGGVILVVIATCAAFCPSHSSTRPVHATDSAVTVLPR